MSRPDQAEARLRLRAAIAYRDLGRADAAARLNVSPATLDRMTGKRGQETKALTWDDLFRVAEVFQLPPEWFSADLSRLAEIVTEGPVVRRRADAALPAPQGELGRLAQDDAPNSADHQQPGRRAAADDPPGSA